MLAPLAMGGVVSRIFTWTFTSDEELERAEMRMRGFAGCKLRQEFVATRLQNPGVEDVQIRINTVSCADVAQNRPTLGTLDLLSAACCRPECVDIALPGVTKGNLCTCCG